MHLKWKNLLLVNKINFYEKLSQAPLPPTVSSMASFCITEAS